MVAARIAITHAHPLLNDRPLAIGADEKTVVVDAKAVLDCGRIDFRRHAAVVGEPSAVHTGARAVLDQLNWSATGSFPFPAGDKDPNFVLSPGEAFLERAANGGGDAAGVPIETQHATKGLEPVRIGKTAQKLSSAVLKYHDFRDGRSKLSHTLKKPPRSPTAVRRKCSPTSTLRHRSSV